MPAVKLRRDGDKFVGLCPFHKERTGSFYVWTDHYHCFGCGAHGDAIEWVRRTKDLSFKDGVRYLGAGRFEDAFRIKSAAYQADPFAFGLTDDEQRKMREAEEIWEASESKFKGTLAGQYLAERGIWLASGDFRFHPKLPCHQIKAALPAAIVAIRSPTGRLTAIQRIWLDPETGLKAAIPVPRKTLGPMGNGSFQLGMPSAHLGLAESAEKAIAASQLFCLPVWGVLGAARFKSVAIPKHVRRLTIFADGDDVGRKAAIEASDYWELAGLRCEIAIPPKPHKDWDDVTKAEAAR